MVKILHLKTNDDIKRKLYFVAFNNKVSQSTFIEIIGRYYYVVVKDRELPKNLDKNTTYKIKVSNNPYIEDETNQSIYYNKCLYYYFNQQELDKETRLKIKDLNKKIIATARETEDKNSLYNEVVRMNYRAEKQRKEKRKCKK